MPAMRGPFPGHHRAVYSSGMARVFHVFAREEQCVFQRDSEFVRRPHAAFGNVGIGAARIRIALPVMRVELLQQ